MHQEGPPPATPATTTNTNTNTNTNTTNNLHCILIDPDELVAYSFAGEEHFSPEFIQSLASPFQHSALALLIPILLAPLSLVLIYTWASPPQTMATHFSFKSLLLPAILALLLYVLISLLIVPLYRRHRARYSQYLPIHTNPISSLSSSTQNLRSSISSALVTFLLPSRWAEYRHRQQQNGSSRVVDARDGDEELGNGTMHRFDSADIGYGIGDSDDEDDEVARGRRDGLSLSMDARSRSDSATEDSDRRLSRELEEGFRDDSDDDEDDVKIDTRRAR